MEPTSTSPHFDLNSLLNLQNAYITNYDKGVEGTSITDLNNKLNDIYDNVQKSQIGANSTLLNQNTVNNILETESQRLIDKKKNIDLAVQGQKRMINLNENYKMRYAAYTHIVIVFVIMVILAITVTLMSQYFTFIPGAIYILLYIIIISYGLVHMYILYNGLSKRNPTNYNEILISAPDVGLGSPAGANSSGVGDDYTNALGPFYNCVGQNCCSQGVIWSPVSGCSLYASPSAASPAPAAA